MRRLTVLSRMLTTGGVAALLWGLVLATLAQPSAVFAQDPPPRPTLTPQPGTPTATPVPGPPTATAVPVPSATALPTLVPPPPYPEPGVPTATATPAPTRAPSRNDDNDKPTPLPTGRVTGTVIDTTTGAPAPGITVRVGDVNVVTDSNGNYNRDSLAPGSYQVLLLLTGEQGVAQQEPILVDVTTGTVVQHLRFASRAAVPAAPAPGTTAPNVPATLPGTGAANNAMAWIVLGALLLVSGVLLRITQRRNAP